MSKLTQRMTGIAAACLLVVGGIAFAQSDSGTAAQGKGHTGADTTQTPTTPLPPSATTKPSTSSDTMGSSSTNSMSSESTPAPRSDRG